MKSPLLSRIQSPKLRVTRVPSTGRVTGVCQRAADISLYDRPAMAYCRQCHSSRNTGIQYRQEDHCVGGGNTAGPQDACLRQPQAGVAAASAQSFVMPTAAIAVCKEGMQQPEPKAT